MSTQTRYNTSRTNFMKQRRNVKPFCLKQLRTDWTSFSKVLKAKIKNLSSGNSNVALEYFDNTVILECTTLSQACIGWCAKPLW